MVTRREAILISLAGYLSRLSIARAAPVAGFSDKQYANAMVIDALGSPGGFDPSESDDAPLSPDRGWTSARIEKILGRNFARLFADVWTS